MNPDSAPKRQCGPSRKRIQNWKNSMDLVMIALMKQQMAEGNFNNGVFSIKAWRKITKSFNESTKKNFNVMHLKNRLKVLKRNFNLFHGLAIRSGWSWDNQNNVPVPRDSIMWEEVIAENTNYVRIKDKPFPGYEDIGFLFAKNTITGRRCHRTYKPETKGQKIHKPSHPTSQWHTSANLADIIDNEVKVELDALRFNQDANNKGLVGASTPPSVHTNLNGSFDQSTQDVPLDIPTTTSPILPSDSVSDACPPSSIGKRSRATSAALTTSEKRRVTTVVEQALIDLVEHGKKSLELVEELLMREKLSMPTIYSMDECWAKLQKIPNLSSEVKLAAMESFNDQFNRWIFMHSEDNMLETWLLRQLSKYYHTTFKPGSSHARHVGPSTGFGSADAAPPKIDSHKIMEFLIEEDKLAEKVIRTLITSGFINDICGQLRNDKP